MIKDVVIVFGMLSLGLWLGYKMHPYEQCSREHVGGDNIGECVWLKLNMRKE